MLHKINLSACTAHLEWVVQLQGDLLRALCDPAVVAGDVTVDWVKARRVDIDAAWVNRFCAWSKEKKSMLDRMQAVATLTGADKQAVVAHYEHNLRYPEAFAAAAAPSPPATTALPDGLSVSAVTAYRDFFEMFYAPIFYRKKGYPINAPDLNGELFTKEQYLGAYHAANPEMKVCPLCDGSMDGAELDHWLAQKHLPELNCHPQNLVEICGACNGRTNKGEKLALEPGQANPFGNWFHPHLRPAADSFEIARQGERVRLASNDGQTQTMLNNFGRLINLGTRWTREWATQIDRLQSKLRGCARRGEHVDAHALRSKLESWMHDATDEIGMAPNSLLEAHVLSVAIVEGSDIFMELLTYATAPPIAETPRLNCR